MKFWGPSVCVCVCYFTSGALGHGPLTGQRTGQAGLARHKLLGATSDMLCHRGEAESGVLVS